MSKREGNQKGDISSIDEDDDEKLILKQANNRRRRRLSANDSGAKVSSKATTTSAVNILRRLIVTCCCCLKLNIKWAAEERIWIIQERHRRGGGEGKRERGRGLVRLAAIRFNDQAANWWACVTWESVGAKNYFKLEDKHLAESLLLPTNKRPNAS